MEWSSATDNGRDSNDKHKKIGEYPCTPIPILATILHTKVNVSASFAC